MHKKTHTNSLITDYKKQKVNYIYKIEDNREITDGI